MSSQTFELVWTRAGLDDVPRDRTLKPVSGEASIHTLPRLTLGEPAVLDEEAGGDLQLVDVIGEGGMGVVWSARQASLDRVVAIKRSRPESPESVARALIGEARILGALEHPNIVPVHVLGVDATGAPALVMKRVEGVAWRDLIKDPDHPAWAGQGTDRLGRHVEIAMAVCRALEFAHDKGVVHRDLKPDNVMIGRFGEVYLMDWGVARRLDGSPRRHVVGTPCYMAPELLDLTMPLGPWTDGYLVGACLHEVLTGRPPHDGATLQEVMRSVHASPEPRFGPDVPAGIAAVTRRALAHDPEARWPSVGALREALEDFLRTRQAVRLAEVARARLDALRAAPDPGVDALFTECRFAYRQSLDAWPGNEDAREGLREALRLMIPRHLSRGDVEGAGALVDELEGLGGDGGDARVSIAAALRERERIRTLRHQTDLSLSAGLRTGTLAGMVAIFGTMAAIILPRPEVYTHRTAFLVMVGSHGVIWTLVFAFRRRFHFNAVTWSLLGTMGGMAAINIAHRALAWRFDTPMAAMLATDLLIMAGAVWASAIVLGRRMAWPSVPLVVGALGIALFPAQALLLFVGFGVGAGLLSTAILGWMWRVGQRESP